MTSLFQHGQFTEFISGLFLRKRNFTVSTPNSAPNVRRMLDRISITNGSFMCFIKPATTVNSIL